jgi:hypothetical protein
MTFSTQEASYGVPFSGCGLLEKHFWKTGRLQLLIGPWRGASWHSVCHPLPCHDGMGVVGGTPALHYARAGEALTAGDCWLELPCRRSQLSQCALRME